MYKVGFKDKLLSRLYSRPELFLSVSFLFLIFVGTVLLLLPVSSRAGISFIDALFTAVSATCVTGLVVLDTGKDFTLFGQIVILSLIQLGALGIMTFAASVLVSMGRRVSSRQAFAMSRVLDQERLSELKSSISFILKATLILEFTGMMALSLRWFMETGRPFVSIYWGIFHSISAFCNAGFSLFSDSFSRWRGDAFMLSILSALIILGGIGFIVLQNLWGIFTGRQKRISIHSKLVLLMSLLLLFLGTVGLFWLEHNRSFQELPSREALLSAFFHSVNARTAGFNSLPISGFSLAGRFLIILLMFIGASSGSTGGGVKTNTIGLLMAAAIKYMRGEEQVVLFRRSIAPYIVHRAVAVLLFSLFALGAGVLALLAVDGELGFSNLVFESVSAFATVGLSTGITPHLSVAGKIIIILLMYVGRVGPLTIALALFYPRKAAKVKYAEGKVLVG